MSLQSGSNVALSGNFPNREVLLSFLESRGIRVVSWGSNIGALIVGGADGSVGPQRGRWKLEQAMARGIPILQADKLLATAAAASELWVSRYAPRCVGDLIGQAAATAELTKWLVGWKIGAQGALVTGPPGIGKTSAVHLVVAACGYDVVEFNASDERSASAVRRYFAEARTSGHCGRQRVVVMDEVDGMSSGDRGGIGELARVIASCAFPIICIANERSIPRMRPLVACCADIRFTRPTKNAITKALMARIVTPEKLPYKAADIETLCERNGNDIRSIINALQFAAPKLSEVEKDSLQRVDAFSAAGRLLGGSDPVAVKEQLVFLDYGLVPLMIAEGYVATCGRPRGGISGGEAAMISRCVSAGTHLSDYDIIDRRIHTSQVWSIMPHAVSAVVSAATVTQGTAPFNIFPSWLGKQSKRLKHRRWVRDMRVRMGCGGGEEMLDRMDTLRTLLFRKGRGADEIVADLTDLNLTRDDMLETLVDLTYKDDAGRVDLDTKLKGAITREWKKVSIPQNEVRGVEEEEVDSDTESMTDLS